MGDRVLFLIPARGGSRRVPRKNLQLVGGIPLVGRAARLGRLAAARLDGGPHRVVCSTDDPEIARVAAEWGAEVLERPAHLAGDEATSVDVALDVLARLDPDGVFGTLVLLQPTSPLSEPLDVVGAVGRHRATGAGVVSVAVTHPPTWHHRLAEGDLLVAEGTLPVAGSGPHQLLTGAIYVCSVEALRRDRAFVVPGATLGWVVPAERSIDIDEPTDLRLAEGLLATRPVEPVRLGDRAIGEGPAFVIAEAGVNHDGDPALAHALIDAAADAGADAVKFQTFDPDALVTTGAPLAPYQAAPESGLEGRAADQREMLRRLALPLDAWPALQRHAGERGITFLSTPFDEASAELLDRMDVPAFKVGSGDLTDIPFLERLARRGRPLLVSTGMATMAEVAAAVDAIGASGGPPLVLLHCVSSYPAAPADANLRAIETMRRAFGIPVGWSDHSPGIEVAISAATLGAAVIEKHITTDRRRPGPDHRSSLEPDEFGALVTTVRAVSATLGDGVKRPVPAEAEIARVARRSLHWTRPLERGATVDADDVAVLRPASGLAPDRLRDVIGRRTARAVTAGAAVDAGDLEGLP